MKKTFLLLFLCFMVLGLSVISGQGTRYNYRKSEPDLGYGVKAGVNIAYQTSNGLSAEIDVRNIISLNGGGYVHYFPFRTVGIQAELLLSGKGAHWSDFYDDMKDQLTYLDIPVLVRYQPSRFINIYAGFQAGLRLSARQKDLETGTTNDVSDGYYFLDPSITAGIEANLPYKINLTLRYIHGLSSATKEALYSTPWSNRVIQVSVGYRISGR